MNKSIKLVTLPSGLCVLHIESEYDIEMITLPSEEVAYQCILASDELYALALESPTLDAVLTNLIAEI